MKNKKTIDPKTAIETQDPYLQRIKANLEEITRIQKEREEERKRIQKEIEEERKKTEEERRKTEKEIADLSKKIKNVNKMVGKLTGSWSKFVVGVAEPGVNKLMKELGIKITKRHKNVEIVKNGEVEKELDLIVEGKKGNREVVFVVEIKSSFDPQEVIDFVNWLKTKFLDEFSFYKNYDIFIALAGARYGDGIKNYALKQGIYILEPSDGIMHIIHPKKPKVLQNLS